MWEKIGVMVLCLWSERGRAKLFPSSHCQNRVKLTPQLTTSSTLSSLWTNFLNGAPRIQHQEMYYVWHTFDHLGDDHKEDTIDHLEDDHKEDTCTNTPETSCPYPA